MRHVVIGFRGKCKRAPFPIILGAQKRAEFVVAQAGARPYPVAHSSATQPPPPISMSEKSIEEKVKDIIVEQLGVNPEQVTSEASFIEHLGADSLDTVELVMAFEEEFNVEVPDEDAEKLQTVGDVVTYITDKTSK